MKYLILLAALALPAFVYADDIDDLAKILRETECKPVKNKAGRITSYHCEGLESETLNTSAPNKFKDMKLTSELEDADLLDSIFKFKDMKLTSELEDADLLDSNEEAKLAR